MDVALFGAGLVIHATRLLKDRGITPENVIVSASHTHGAQAGYSNFPGFNTVPPTKTTPTEVALAPADPQLYGFMVAPARGGDPAGRRRPRPGRARMGRGDPARADAEPQHRGAPRQPRDHARLWRGERRDGPGRLRAHDRPRGARPARGQAARAPARADRRLHHVRQPRHGQPADLPLLQRRPPRVGYPGGRGRPAAARTCAGPGSGERLRQRRRGRRLVRARPRRPGGRRLRRARGGQRHHAGVAGRQAGG